MEKCLVGIHRKTGVVEIIASLKSNVDDHLKEIDASGCYPAIADTELAREAWGKKVDSARDLLSA